MNRRNFIAGIIGSLFLPNITKEKLPEPILPPFDRIRGLKHNIPIYDLYVSPGAMEDLKKFCKKYEHC